MSVGLYLEGVPVTALPDLARDAERAGFRDALKGESEYGDALTAATAMALATRTLRVGSSVTGIYGRSPVMLAMTVASLAALSGEHRPVVLGLGVQSRRYVEQWHGVPYARPLTRMRETIHVLRRLFAGERVTFVGETIRVEGFRLAHPPPVPPVIYLGAHGPQMIALAGELCDGLLGYFYSPAYLERVVRPHLEKGARRAGRSLDGFDLTLALPALVSDLREAHDLVRPQVVMYATAGSPSYNTIMELSGFGRELTAMREHLAHGDMVGAVQAVTDAMVDTFTFSGTATAVRRRVASVLGAGVSSVYLLPVPPGHFYPLFKGHFPDSIAVPEPSREGLQRNIAAILAMGAH
jgi:probable F420-dependent oxidoreductase